MHLFRALDIENIQHGAIGCRLARTLGHSLSQQAFELLQVAKLRPNVFEMVSRYVANLATRSLFGSPEPK